MPQGRMDRDVRRRIRQPSSAVAAAVYSSSGAELLPGVLQQVQAANCSSSASSCPRTQGDHWLSTYITNLIAALAAHPKRVYLVSRACALILERRI
jgi:hypothetical protein